MFCSATRKYLALSRCWCFRKIQNTAVNTISHFSFYVTKSVAFFFVAEIPEIKTNADQWVLANINVVGYYRVNYDEGNWVKLLNALRNKHTVRNIASFKYREIYPGTAAGTEQMLWGITASFLCLFLTGYSSLEQSSADRWCLQSGQVLSWSHRVWNVMLTSPYNHFPGATAMLSQQGRESHNSASARDHRVPVQWERLHPLEISDQQPGLFLPHVWPKWGLRSHAGKQHKGSIILRIDTPSRLLSSLPCIF